MVDRPYADGVAAYALAGWPAILPVPSEAKSPPPVGFTGADGRDTTPDDLVAWVGSHAEHSIAVRLPDGVIGIDVDHYRKGNVDKRGGDSLAEYEQRWGPLPATWRSSARDLPSGIRFYLVRPGRYATKLGESIEIIQRHHRYAVVWPSPHVEVGRPYAWYDPAGAQVTDGSVPKPIELPELPVAWVAGLREGATEAGSAAADVTSGRVMLGVLTCDDRPPCAEVHSATITALAELEKASQGSRHDVTTARVHHLVQLGAAGHPGVGACLLELQARWGALTAGEDRGAEWERMLLTSARKAVTALGRREPVDRDPCLMVGTVHLAAPAPVDDRPGAEQPDPVLPPRQLHPLEIIGAHAFEPRGSLDQVLAEAVLERTYPVLRYAYDARAWLLRGPEVWDTRADLAEWAVALLADRMPKGDPDAGKGKGADEVTSADLELADQAKRRARMMTAAPARAVAGKMRALVAGGVHPCSLALADLDCEPWLLWAGGIAYDLRASHTAPTPAQIDPATPHLRSAGLAPAVVPTPLWDAFLTAVWPDPELRDWALRVLSIAVTGYSDRALPILIGETGRGKTQLIALIMSVLGTYAHAADPRLLAGADNTHASITYALMGRRLSFIDEAPRGSHGGTERLKQLTGGGSLTANAMHKDPVTFRPTHTLILTANDDPALTDPAVRARVRLIPCEGDPEQVSAARATIGHLGGAAWRAEAPGVLAALMAEAAAWLTDPTSASTSAGPETYRYHAEQLAAEQDPITSWLDDETEPDETGERSRALYEAFVSWCRAGNHHPNRIPSETKWGRELTRRGFAARHTDAGKRRPLRLRQRGGWIPQPVSQPVRDETGETPNRTNHPDGFADSDGLTDGFALNPSGEDKQVNPSVSSEPDGLTGCFPSRTPCARTHTRTHTRESQWETGVNPSEPVSPPATQASQRREANKAATRAVKIAATAGDRIQLPAKIDRPGELAPLDLGAAMAAARGQAREWGELTVDVETTGYPVGHAEHALRTVQLGGVTEAVDFDASDPEQRAAVAELLAEAPRLVAHSATADLVPLDHAGLLEPESAWERMYDTVIPAKLADPASTGSDPGLKQLSAAVLGEHATAPAADEARAALFKAGRWLTKVPPSTPVERSGWAQVDPACATMVRYAASDVLDTAALSQALPKPDPAVHERERIAQRMTARVAHRGLCIDAEHVDRLLAEHTAARDAAAARVRAYGVDNPGSDQQVGAKLASLGAALPQTPTGRPSVAAGVLEPLKASELGRPVGALVAAVLDYRHHDTACGTFLEPYRELCVRGDGRARPTVYTLGADTGRMSCVRPNLQQVPREGGFRACITADPGELLISADFSGVEIRVMAALSQDPTLLRMLAEGVDLHSVISAQVFGPDWTKGDRYMVKRGVFGWAYGGGIPTLARQVGCSESIMASVVDVLAATAPGYVAWASAVKTAVKDGRTQMPTYAGRVIHLDKRQPHKAPNYCIQGTARELLVDALIRWQDTRWGSATILPVHDEIVAAIPEADAAEATAALVARMETELYGVSIAAEASTPSFAWADAS